ncbi:hypothetical protein ACFWBI_08815 [Streptomyces sp. NPDC059982]|uniref:hypothetical protein n=1 Tax=unclassified Streptomyces TaxID=2593676 RepID=UPI0036B2E9B8
MTHSPTPTELLALRTANAALLTQDSAYDFAATIVFALGSAQLLQSPETAAELARLRLLQNAQPAELSEAQVDALADAGNRALNDHYHEDLCLCSAWPESCVSSGNYFAGAWDTAAFGIGMAAVIGVWESMRAPAEADELARLRARVAALETERHETNAALSDAAEALRADRDRIAELETVQARPAPLLYRDAHGDTWRAEGETLTLAATKAGGPVVGRPWTEPHTDVARDFGPLVSLEDPHDSLLHHTYRLGHDLPEIPHA